MRFADALNFASKLTVPKIYNSISVIFSFYISRLVNQSIQWGAPLNISIEPTTNCNLGCPECPSGLKNFTRPTGNINLDFYKKAIDEVADKLIYLYLYFQGEPYMHPDFLQLVKYASEQKIYTVTSTNAHFLTERKAIETVESGLDRILISIDGTTQNSYEQYRVGGSLDKVVEGTKNLIGAKRKLQSKSPHIIFQFLVVKPNENEIESVRKLAEEIGVDEVKLKTAQIYDYENGSDLMPTIEKYSRYKEHSDGRYEIKNELKNHCWKLWHSSVITWDGKVVPCCFDKDATHLMGNISESRFEEIWQNSSYKSFRKRITQGRKEIDICKNCSEGLKVWV